MLKLNLGAVCGRIFTSDRIEAETIRIYDWKDANKKEFGRQKWQTEMTMKSDSH